MSSGVSRPYRQNLEPVGDAVEAGAWRLSTLHDPLSERRFLHYSLESRALPEFQPSLLTFRAQAAHALSPDVCPEVLSLSVDPGRIEFLTEHFEVPRAGSPPPFGLSAALETLMRTLGIFTRARFHIGDLFPEALGIRPPVNPLDEEGGASRQARRIVLLPTAYVLPYLSSDGTIAPSARLRITLKSATKLRTLDRHKLDAGALHFSLVVDLINQLTASPRATATTPSAVTAAASAAARGEIDSLWSLYERAFGEAMPGPPPPSPIARSEDPTATPVIESIVARASIPGSVTVLTGDRPAEQCCILRGAVAMLDEAEAYTVHEMDEWDLFTRSKRRTGRRRKSGTVSVWLVDDVEETAFAFSDFAAAMLSSDAYPPGAVILGRQTSDGDATLRECLDTLKRQRGEAYEEMQGGLATTASIRAALSALGTGERPDGIDASDPATTFLDSLQDEDRQLLEFLSVARFAMPLDLVTSVFSESADTVRHSILRLSKLDVIEAFCRHLEQGGAVSMFLKVKSTVLRHAVYETIPDSRRAKLHRSVALLAEQHGFFPAYFLIVHGLASGEAAIAARHAVAYLREHPSDQQHPFVVSLCTELVGREPLKALSLPDQILLVHDVSATLLQRGRASDAEKVLMTALDVIEGTEGDQKLKSAQRLTTLYRLLADRWEARGEFKRALDLLDRARGDLQAALPIPDQAQLLNDIGWLQYRLGDYENSMESCRLSLNTLNANQYPGIVAQALNLMGVVHFNTSRYEQAISYYEQSAFLRERLGDDNALAASFNNLALAYQAKSEYEKALDHYHRSLDLKQRQNNRVGIAGGYLNLALLYLELRKFEEAEEKCRQSLAICDETGNAQLAADNYITLGDIALEGGDFEAAERHYQASCKISHEREAINEEMGALRRLSSLCLKGSRLKEARVFVEAAQKLVRRIGSKYETAQIEVIFGDLELAEQRGGEALEHYERAAHLYMALSKTRLAATVLSKIGLLHADGGNTFEGRQYLDRAQEFIRTDIGRELPEEFVRLQQRLLTYPAHPTVPGEAPQKLLMAFYDLATLADFVQDRHAFLRQIMDVIWRVVGPKECFLALSGDARGFFVVNRFGVQARGLPDTADTLFHRAMLLARPVESTSTDVADLVADFSLPEGQKFVCVPLKAMGDDLGCLLFYFDADRIPLSNEDTQFLTTLSRQTSSFLKLMLSMNEDFVSEELLVEPQQLSVEAPERDAFENLIGKSEAMQKIFRTLDKVKNTDSGILIMGESGTGKSALARAIHFSSPRRKWPFQEIHCAQIPHNLLESELFGHERGSFTGAVQRKLGLCEVANGGTVFLDDINVMPVETQTKLLHFIESKSFVRLGGTQRLTSDVRIIAASNENLEDLCREGKFREDLYFRLKVIPIDLPPIRERKEDLIAIAMDYLKRSCTEKGIPTRTLSPETIELFHKAEWRGNVRELQNVLERIIIMSDETVITPNSLPDDFLREVMGTTRHTPRQLDELVDEIVRLRTYSESSPLLPALEAMLAKRMVEHLGSKSQAARFLGVSKPTLYARLRDYDRLH